MAARGFHKTLITRRLGARLNGAILLDGACEGVVYRIAGLGEGGFAGKVGGQGMVGRRDAGSGVHGIQVKGLDQMVGQDMLQKEVESMAVVRVAEVAELVQKDVVLEHARQAHDAEVQVDVAFGRAAAPVGRVVLDGHSVVCETVVRRQCSETTRQLSLGLAAERLYLFR